MAINLGLLEAALVGFGGAFVGALAEYADYTQNGAIKAAIAGGVAFFAVLGYGGYQAHTKPPVQ